MFDVIIKNHKTEEKNLWENRSSNLMHNLSKMQLITIIHLVNDGPGFKRIKNS